VSDALRAAILAAADAVDAARPELGRLDGVAGDGDHGMTMSIGVRNIRTRFAAAPSGTSTPDLLRDVALAMADVGGAIGPLYSSGLTAMAATIEATGSARADPVTRLLQAVEAAELAVVGLGHARPGDKTLIDALHPMVGSLRRAEAEGDDLLTAAEMAATTAEAGAASTADMVARVGRASRLGERSRGHPDAGATSLAIIVRAMAEACRRAPVDDEQGPLCVS